MNSEENEKNLNNESNETEDKSTQKIENSDEYGNMPKIDIPAYEKERGNEKYKAGLIPEAAKHYSKAILGMQFLIKDNVIDNQETMLKLIKEIEIPCNLNLAQCYLKMKEYKNAISHTSKVLEIENDNVKALYRRGIAYLSLQEFDCARDDLKKAMDIDPKNSEVYAALTQVKQEKVKFNEKLKQMSQKMLNSLDYSDLGGSIKITGFKEKMTSVLYAMSPKRIWTSIKYHAMMLYLIPVGFISERCCKKRMPASFFKKNT